MANMNSTYRPMQDQITTDPAKWRAIYEAERQKAEAAAVKPTTGPQGVQETWDTSGRHGSGDRPVQSGTSGADEFFMSDQDHAQLQQYKQQYAAAQTQAEKDAAHAGAEALRARYGYSGGTDGSMYLTGLNYLEREDDTQSGGEQNGAATGTGSQAGRYDTGTLRGYLDQWRTAAQEQQEAKIDYAVKQAVDQLERALADAQPQFREQAEAVARDELQALDNSALYAEARGDKGGIGQGQYNEIQAAAARNRLAVQQAQTKLATDTARQIEDLRDQGEFEKADAALEISQSYLSQLVSLEQWAAEYDLSYDQFQASLAQWQAEYELAMAQFRTGVDQWKAEYDLSLKQYETDKDLSYGQLTGRLPSTGELTLNGQSQLASMGEAMLGAGIMPSGEQLAAMGITESQAQSYLMAQQLEAAAKKGSGSSGGKTGGSSGSRSETEDQTGYDALFAAALASGYPESFIKNHYKRYGFTSSGGLYSDYKTWLKAQEQAASNAPEKEVGLSDLNTASINALGLGPLNYDTVDSLVQQGVLTVYDAGSKLGVKWANGWSAEKYKNGPVLPGLPKLG